MRQKTVLQRGEEDCLAYNYCTPAVAGLKLDSLDDGGSTHTAAGAHGDEAGCLVLALEFVDQGAN